jgi:hypothetical protein
MSYPLGMMKDMEAQLHLLADESAAPEDDTASWRLDDSTRAVGRRGVAQSRGALRAALRHRGLDDPDQADDNPRHASAA